MIFLKLMGLPVELCNCCGLIETNVRLHNRFVCVVCRGLCALPFDEEHCAVLADLAQQLEEPPTAEP